MSQTPLRLLFRTSPLLLLRRSHHHHHHHHHHEPRAFIQACRNISTGPSLRPTNHNRSPTVISNSHSVPSSRRRRPFSSSSAVRATTVVQNPRVDDDGVDMSIEISERAAKVCGDEPPCVRVCVRTMDTTKRTNPPSFHTFFPKGPYGVLTMRS